MIRKQENRNGRIWSKANKKETNNKIADLRENKNSDNIMLLKINRNTHCL